MQNIVAVDMSTLSSNGGWERMFLTPLSFSFADRAFRDKMKMRVDCTLYDVFGRDDAWTLNRFFSPLSSKNGFGAA